MTYTDKLKSMICTKENIAEVSVSLGCLLTVTSSSIMAMYYYTKKGTAMRGTEHSMQTALKEERSKTQLLTAETSSAQNSSLH